MLPRPWPALIVGIPLVVLSACAAEPPRSPDPTGSRPTLTPAPTQGGPVQPTPAAGPTQGGPNQSTPAQPTDGSTSPPGPATPDSTGAIDIDWLAGDPASEFSSFDVISDAASVAGTLVAVGAYEDEAGNTGAVAWTSADGRLWRRAAAVPGASSAAMEDVTGGPSGLIAVGYEMFDGGSRPRVWSSLDGLAWQAVDDSDLSRGEMSAVAANSLGYVALGFDPETNDGLAWTSRDGSDWSAALVVPSFEVQPSVNDVIALGDGFIAYGSTSRDERAALWTSLDGRQWQPVERFPTTPGSSVNAVTASGTRLVAVGASYPDRGTLALAWTSTDGLEWQRVLDDDANERGEMLGAVPVGTGFLAVGSAGREQREELRAAVWSSVDGLSWQRQPDQPTFQFARMSEVIRAGPGLVALGERADDPAMEVFAPAVWVGVAR